MLALFICISCLVLSCDGFIPSFRSKGPIPRQTMMTHMSTRTLEETLTKIVGDYVTIDLSIRDGPGGAFVQTDFDQGTLKFCIGGGGLHPAVHEMASRLSSPGETLTEIKSGGTYFPQATADIPIENAPGGLKVGDLVKLSNGIKAKVTRITDKILTLDANAPLAGKDLEFSATLVERKPKDVLMPFTVACGCFWGIELAMQRVKGVIYTAVGYTQGRTNSPSYEEVCSGTTGHTEAVYCLFDPSIVSYNELLEVFWARHDPTQLNRQGNDRGTQYRGGIYYHDDAQKQIAIESMRQTQEKYLLPLATELLPTSTFWVAEEYHQQYLERNSYQSASKSATDSIRCYG